MTLNSGLYSGFALRHCYVGLEKKNLFLAPREQAGGDFKGFGQRKHVERVVVFPTAEDNLKISSYCLSRCIKKCLSNNLSAPTAKFPFRRLQVFDLSGLGGGFVYLRATYVTSSPGCGNLCFFIKP